jgi:hypothetical protein
MKRAWIAMAALMSVGLVGWLLCSEGAQSEAQLSAKSTEPAAETEGVSVEKEQARSCSDGDEPALEPIAATPFKRESERPEKLVVRVVQNTARGVIPVPMAIVSLHLGTRKKFRDEWLEDWKKSRQSLTNRYGEVRFPLVTSGSWWLQVSKEQFSVEQKGDASEVRDGVIEVRLATPCKLHVQLVGEDLPKEVDAGWSGVHEEVDAALSSGTAAHTTKNWRSALASVGQRTRMQVNAEGVLLLDPIPGKFGRVAVWSSQTGHVGWVDVPALAEGEERHIELTLQRYGVLSARFPANWPQDATVSVRLLKVETESSSVEQQQVLARETVSFVVSEAGRYVVAASCETPKEVLCASTTVEVRSDLGHVDLGVLEVGPASLELCACFADGSRPEAGMLFNFELMADLFLEADYMGYYLAVRRPAVERGSLVIKGLPSGISLIASLRLEDPPLTRPSATLKDCTHPRKELVTMSGYNVVTLVLDMHPKDHWQPVLTAKIGPLPEGAWKTNQGALHYRVGARVIGSGSFDFSSGTWKSWFAPGTVEVEVLLTRGDQWLGPRVIQLDPNGETEVWLDDWKPVDEALLNAALARFAPPHLTKSQR